MGPSRLILLGIAAVVLLLLAGPGHAQNAATSTFNHFTTGFPLTGTHVSVSCASCHVNGRLKSTPTQCIACHAINREGGTVGPELNLPKSIVEYRPVDQIKQYIRNPATFRYSNMPANPQLTDQQLDQLIAYFTAMQALKHDPGRTP